MAYIDIPRSGNKWPVSSDAHMRLPKSFQLLESHLGLVTDCPWSFPHSLRLFFVANFVPCVALVPPSNASRIFERFWRYLITCKRIWTIMNSPATSSCTKDNYFDQNLLSVTLSLERHTANFRADHDKRQAALRWWHNCACTSWISFCGTSSTPYKIFVKPTPSKNLTSKIFFGMKISSGNVWKRELVQLRDGYMD